MIQFYWAQFKINHKFDHYFTKMNYFGVRYAVKSNYDDNN